jgi:hypothetical protein
MASTVPGRSRFSNPLACCCALRAGTARGPTQSLMQHCRGFLLLVVHATDLRTGTCREAAACLRSPPRLPRTPGPQAPICNLRLILIDLLRLRKMQFPLNNGQATAVNTGLGLGGDSGVPPKAP